MKRVLLAVMFGIGVLGFAQGKKSGKIAQKYIIDKIKNYNPTDLVPYSKDGEKWALMDAKSRKILTDFVMRIPSTFNPEFMADINIGKWVYGMMINTNYDILPLVTYCPIPEWFDVKEIDELGFQVDEQGRMTAYDKNKDYEYISRPILYKGEYYIIIIKKDKTYVLINQKGVEQEGFQFRVMGDTYYKDKESGEIIFYVEGFDGKKGLVTISGKKKLYGELMNNTQYSFFGYNIQNDSENTNEIKKSGVVDITTQEWLIKPQEKYKIYDIIYTSSEELKKYDVTNRNKATIYFLATDQSGQHFVLDIKGNPILPKE